MADATTIRRIPTADELSGMPSQRPTGANPGIDVNAGFQGAQNLASGIGELAQGIGNAGADLSHRQNVSDLSAADARWMEKSNAIGSSFDDATDWQTFDKRVTTDSQKAMEEAAAAINDPLVKQQWLDKTNLQRLALIQAVNEKGNVVRHDEQRATLEASVDTLTKLYSDPGTPDAVRQTAKKQIEASIDLAHKTGAINETEAGRLRRSGIDGAQEQLALNRARADLMDVGVDPQMVYNSMGVTPTDAGGQGLVSAAITANNGKMPDIDPALAKVTADILGDANFPSDPALVKAYLSNPETGAKYAAATVKMLSERYKGDPSAVAVALDPQGGTVLADKWAKSGHNEASLPDGVRTRVRATLSAYRPNASSDRIPIRTSPNIDLEAIDPAVLDRFETVQTQFGEAINIIPSVRGGEHNSATGGAATSTPLDNRALELDVSMMSDARKEQLVKIASAMGFTGIGIYKNTLHLDTGERRVWGVSGKAAPAWATSFTHEHMAEAGVVMPIVATVTPDRYSGLTFDQRLQVAGEAKAEMKRRAIDLQSSIETIAQNAPAAIAATGKYDGHMPTAIEFVHAYQSASDGLKQFQAFKASVDTAKVMFGFRTESADAIMSHVAAAAPTSSGNDAAMQSRTFDAISAAAEQTLKARAADPAQYVLQAFPDIAKVFTDAQESKDPAAYQAALQKMQVAQEKLGITEPHLIPKNQATAAAQAFNDTTRPTDERIGAVAGLVLRTGDESQQLSIFKQLLDSGVPDYTQGAMAAIARGDVAASQNLMRAVMIDPTKLAGTLPSNIKATDIDAAVQSKLFDEGQIGDIVYGIADGSADNFNRLRADSALINRDVQLHLLDGSAGGSLDKAIDLTVKDMYGDVQPVTGGGVKISLPKNTDPAPYRVGFNALQPKVRAALSADMHNGMVFVLGKDVDPVTAGMGETIRYGVENAVDQVISNGYFINAGEDRYQFLNPFTGSVIAGSDGKPLVFTKGEVLSAGAAVEAPDTGPALY